MGNRQATFVIPGGSGFLGGVLARHFVGMGGAVVVPSRQNKASQGGVRYVAWDGETVGEWARELEGAAAVVNLAGRSVNCRYNPRNRRDIYESRLTSTRAIGEAIAGCASPPPVWINSSSATIYRHALDRPMDETTGEIGTGFSVDVCLRWEKALNEAPTPDTRKVALRSALVLGRGGGVMEAFLTMARLGLAGTLGRGDQFVSWVHERDFARAVEWLIEHSEREGPVNCASPNPVPNAEFMRTLRQVCRQPIGLPAKEWMLEIGALVLRTETELLLKSRRVVPTKLLDSDFKFEYAELARALEVIVGEP